MKDRIDKRTVAPQLVITSSSSPNAERCLRGLMILLNVDRQDIEQRLKARREERDRQHEGAIH